MIVDDEEMIDEIPIIIITGGADTIETNSDLNKTLTKPTVQELIGGP